MNEIVQWLIVTAAIAGAAVYLIRRLIGPKGGCRGRCASCPMRPEPRGEWPGRDRSGLDSPGDDIRECP